MPAGLIIAVTTHYTCIVIEKPFSTLDEYSNLNLISISFCRLRFAIFFCSGTFFERAFKNVLTRAQITWKRSRIRNYRRWKKNRKNEVKQKKNIELNAYKLFLLTAATAEVDNEELNNQQMCPCIESWNNHITLAYYSA